MISPPLKWHGGKTYLAEWIRSFDPAGSYCHRVHPYGGGLGEFWNWPHEGVSEVVNDIDGRLTNFYRCLQDYNLFAYIRRLLETMPFSSLEWKLASDWLDDEKRPLIGISAHHAAMFFVLVRQSRQGLMKDFATLSRNRTRRGMNEQVSSWLTAIEGLPEVHERLKRVVIENMPAVELIRREDGPNTLFYLDPPYMHETRTVTNAYAHEMRHEQHDALLCVLNEIRGRFMLSGYHCDLYDEWAKAHRFVCHEKQIDNKAGSGETKRTMTECLWCNFGKPAQP